MTLLVDCNFRAGYVAENILANYESKLFTHLYFYFQPYPKNYDSYNDFLFALVGISQNFVLISPSR